MSTAYKESCMRRTFSKHMEFSILFFMIIGTLVGYITITNARIDFIKRVSNDLYSNDAISWTGSYSLNKLIKGNNNQNEVRLWSKGQIELYINEVENNEILYVDLAESTRAIYFTDNKIKLPITSGRFFTPNDFTSEVSYEIGRASCRERV